jgi:hypothetical protein
VAAVIKVVPFSLTICAVLQARGGKGPIFEDGPGFESAFKLFHGQDGIVPLSGRSYVHDENRSESTDVKPQPALPFNPLAGRAASISLSAFGPFGFNFFNGKGKKQNKKPDNLDQSHKKPNNPDQNSMKVCPDTFSVFLLICICCHVCELPTGFLPSNYTYLNCVSMLTVGTT